MFLNADHTSEWLHMITMVVPHIVILVTGILNFLQGRRNGRRLKRVERALNGKAESEVKRE